MLGRILQEEFCRKIRGNYPDVKKIFCTEQFFKIFLCRRAAGRLLCKTFKQRARLLPPPFLEDFNEMQFLNAIALPILAQLAQILKRIDPALMAIGPNEL